MGSTALTGREVPIASSDEPPPAWRGAVLAAPASDQRQLHVYVVPGGVGVGADDVRLVHQRLRLFGWQAGQGNAQRDLQAEAVGDRADPDPAGDLRVRRKGNSFLAGNELQGAKETGRVTTGEQLFRIAAFAASVHFLWWCQAQIQLAI